MLLFAAAAIYAGWQLVGLRYTNSDDIFFCLYAYIFDGRLLEFANWIAQFQARIQAFINMPMMLLVDGLSSSVIYDFLNVGSFWLIYTAFAWLLAEIGCATGATCLAAISLVLFPLHYYFTFPQGYPVVECWSLIVGLASAALLASSRLSPSRWKFTLALVTFTASLFGPEYNFALHPFFIALALYASPRGSRGIARRAAPFIGCWVISLAICVGYGTYQHLTRPTAAITTPVFNPLAMWRTFWVLQEHAFLPAGLVTGISLDAAGVHSQSRLPNLLRYTSLFTAQTDWNSLVIVFCLAWGFCTTALVRSRMPYASLYRAGALCVAIVVVPSMVLSASGVYQFNVLGGYVQGHLATFYTQMGGAGLMVLVCQLLCRRLDGRARLLAAGLLGVVLATDACVTFVYNNLNRQVMSANRQRWDAFRDLAKFVASDRPDLVNQSILAPDFWRAVGVSSIPGVRIADGPNYWTVYSRVVLQAPMLLVPQSEAVAAAMPRAAFFAMPAGYPVTFLLEDGGTSSRLTLLASRPIAGRIVGRTPVINVLPIEWTCRSVCSTTIFLAPGANLADLQFLSQTEGPRRLLNQFFLNRNGAFALPLGMVSAR
jgi:hypothetical protein